MSGITNRLKRLIQGVEKLNSFKSPEDIAKFFQDMGYRGRCGHPGKCVASNFLKDCIGDPDADIQTVCDLVYYHWHNDNDSHTNELSLGLSFAVRDFLSQFDTKDWPDLIEQAND